MEMEDKNKSARKNDNGSARFRVAKIMTAIVLIALQIFLLLLKFYFHHENEKEKAIAALQNAQEKIDDLAQRFELETRFTKQSKNSINHIQDNLDQDRKHDAKNQ